MPNVMNFDKAKISVMVFTSRDDFAEFMRKMDSLFDRAKKYPVFYVIRDPETSEADLYKIQDWLQDMLKKTDDFEMVKRNLEKGRFPEVTEDLVGG